MKRSFCFDTAAMVSLGHTDTIPLIVDSFHVIITDGVLDELKAIAERDDDDGKGAQKRLDLQKKLEIRTLPKQKHAEDELFIICKAENHLLVSDDIEAIKQFQAVIKCYYSVHIIFLLYYKKVITKESALFNIEKMRSSRDWKTNLISVAARSLFS